MKKQNVLGKQVVTSSLCLETGNSKLAYIVGSAE